MQGIVGGRHAGAEDGLAAHAFRAAVDIGIVLVVALGFQDGAVRAHHDRIGHGFVVAQADDAHIVAQRAQHGRHGPQAAENPAFGREGAQSIGAGIKGVDLQVDAHGLVPALLLGVPDGKGFLTGQPGRGNLDQIGGCGGQGRAQTEEGHQDQAETFFQPHRRLRVVKCFAEVGY